MVVSANNGIDGLYKHIMGNAHLDEYLVARDSSSLGAVSFVQLGQATRRYVTPFIENMDDINRMKAHFMLDVALLNILRKSDGSDSSRVFAIDVHFSTLIKTAFRSRYLFVLADLVKNSDSRFVLNIINVPLKTQATRFCDLLRYLLPILKNVSVQISQDTILSLDLTKISANYFVLSVPDLTQINHSQRRDIVMARLAQLPKYSKEIIVRNVTQITAREQEEPGTDAFYL